MTVIKLILWKRSNIKSMKYVYSKPIHYMNIYERIVKRNKNLIN